MMKLNLAFKKKLIKIQIRIQNILRNNNHLKHNLKL